MDSDPRFYFLGLLLCLGVPFLLLCWIPVIGIPLGTILGAVAGCWYMKNV